MPRAALIPQRWAMQHPMMQCLIPQQPQQQSQHVSRTQLSMHPQQQSQHGHRMQEYLLLLTLLFDTLTVVGGAGDP